jgi:hypothetical protein
MQHPVTPVPPARVPSNARKPVVVADARLRAAASRQLDYQRRRASGHRRALVSVWLHELARR